MRLVPLAVTVAALAAVGCGGGDHLNTRQVERAIGAGLELESGSPSVDVECPQDVELRAGDTFECTATSADTEATVTVRQLDDSGRVTWRVRR